MQLELGEAIGPQVHRLLRERIIRGDLMPGARLSETEIAAQYDLSRQPVREAFIKLAEENLVEVRPQRGTFVTRISVPSVMTARFIREAVEADVVRNLASTITPAMLEELEENLAAQRSLEGPESGRDFMRLDEAFHRALSQFCGVSAVADHLETLKIPMNRVRYISAQEFPRQKLIAQHGEILRALKEGDGSSAEAFMREHLREITRDLPEIVALHPVYFAGAEVLGAR